MVERRVYCVGFHGNVSVGMMGASKCTVYCGWYLRNGEVGLGLGCRSGNIYNT